MGKAANRRRMAAYNEIKARDARDARDEQRALDRKAAPYRAALAKLNAEERAIRDGIEASPNGLAGMRKPAPARLRPAGRINASVEAYRVTCDNPIRARGYDTPCHVAATAEARRMAIAEQKREKVEIIKDGKLKKVAIGHHKRTPDRIEFRGQASATIVPTR